MTLGFSSAARVEKLKQELLTWNLYQVEILKFHVMFWFENGHCLLNAAYRFDFHSADGSIAYTYDVQADGTRKSLTVDSILMHSIKNVEAIDQRRLALTFDNGDQLTIHDSPDMRSAWFCRYNGENHNAPSLWSVDDLEPEDFS